MAEKIFMPQWVIERKRDGEALTPEEIRVFIERFTSDEIPDYQMAALAMAIFFRGMDGGETAALTEAMMHSGELISFEGWPRPVTDKHSTGGIGDNLSLMIAPLAASLGLAAPMIAGRGLGITGGTLDKLESIAGYNVNLDVEEFKRVTREVGCAIVGQTARLAPADRKLYALRDVTGTVPSIPLITASIMSKKLAGGAGSLVLDVKCGRGAFMLNLEQARDLALNLLRIGRSLGREVSALITDMEQPLGRSIGNALEVKAALETLSGGGSADARALTLELTAEMALLSGLFTEHEKAWSELAARLDDGRALEFFRRMVVAQGGDARMVDDPRLLLQPRHRLAVESPRAGYVGFVDARRIGRIALQLGAGRKLATDTIDYAAGIDALAQAGDRIEKGQPLMWLHGADCGMVEALVAEALSAVRIDAQAPAPRKLVLERVKAAEPPYSR